MRLSLNNIKYVNEVFREGIRECFVVVTTEDIRIFNNIYRKLPKCVKEFMETHNKQLINESELVTIYTYK